MNQTQLNRVCSFLGWMIALGIGGRAAHAQGQDPSSSVRSPAKSQGEVIWLADLTKHRPVGMCGNSGEFEWPTQTGIVIDEDGEIIERCPKPVWAGALSDHLVLITTRPHENAIPTRTIIGDRNRVSIETDLRPRVMGCGWIMFDQGGLFGRSPGTRTNHRLDVSSSEDHVFFTLDAMLSPVDDVADRLGIDLGRDSLLGLTEPWCLPVIREADTGEQRIIKDDGTRSRRSFLHVDLQRRHPSFIYVATEGRRWVYDPIGERKMMPIWFAMDAGRDSGLQALVNAEGEPATVYDDAFNELGVLGERVQPMFTTGADILVCNDRSRHDAYRGRIPRAYKVNLDLDTPADERLTELDVSWIKAIEPPIGGPVYTVRNQQDELVLIDESLEPIAHLGASVECKRITRSGRVLVVDRPAGEYLLYDAQGRLMKTLDVAEILGR